MLADNVKHYVLDDIVDFDAVSLYPSAIARLYTLEGKPKVLSEEMLNQEFLLAHLFEDEQLEPTADRFMSGFFIECVIERVKIHRHFPLIVWNPAHNNRVEHERSTNDPCVMYMDHITFQDLIRFQGCDLKPIRGYFFNEKRDIRCREVIRNLFDLRARYKREGNPLQNIIKLLLNSIYGKTILKPINTKLRFINSRDKHKYIANRYHYIKNLEGYDSNRKFLATEFKPYAKHFSFCTFGVNILSMSKRIMNELICLAEDIGIEIYYQDTDSIQLRQVELGRLSEAFESKYHRKLIGKELGQFHEDYEPF